MLDRGAHRHLLGRVVERGVDLRVRELGPHVRRVAFAFVEGNDGSLAKDLGDDGIERLGVGQRGGLAGDVIDEGREIERRLTRGQRPGDGSASAHHVADLRLRWRGDGGGPDVGDERFDVDVAGRLFAPCRVALLGRQGVLGGPGREVDGVGEGGVRRGGESGLVGELLDDVAALGPVLEEVLRQAGDAHELVVVAVAFDGQLEAFMEVPGERMAIDRSARELPLEGDKLVEASPFAVVAGAHEIEHCAVRVELRVVLAADVVVERGGEDVTGDDLASAGADAGVRAVLAHDGVERPAHRIAMTVLDLLAELVVRDRPERGDRLVSAEGEVEAGAAFFVVGVACQGRTVVGRQAGDEVRERGGLDVVGVVEAEET